MEIGKRPQYPAYVAFCERRKRLVEQFMPTPLARAVRVSTTACRAWFRRDNSYTRARVVETDAMVQREARRDPAAACLYAEITTLRLQIQALRRALALDEEAE